MYQNAEAMEAQSSFGVLLPGEIVQEECHDCYLALPSLKSRAFGQLFFSNYKLIFVLDRKHPSFAQFDVRGKFAFPSSFLSRFWPSTQAIALVPR